MTCQQCRLRRKYAYAIVTDWESSKMNERKVQSQTKNTFRAASVNRTGLIFFYIFVCFFFGQLCKCKHTPPHNNRLDSIRKKEMQEREREKKILSITPKFMRLTSNFPFRKTKKKTSNNKNKWDNNPPKKKQHLHEKKEKANFHLKLNTKYWLLYDSRTFGHDAIDSMDNCSWFLYVSQRMPPFFILNTFILTMIDKLCIHCSLLVRLALVFFF